jgi:hypothetical protein
MVENADTGKPERKQVTIGVKNAQYVQVLTGLNEGDKLVEFSSGAAVNAPTSTSGGFRALR